MGAPSSALFEFVTLKIYRNKSVSNVNCRGTLNTHMTSLNTPYVWGIIVDYCIVN